MEVDLSLAPLPNAPQPWRSGGPLPEVAAAVAAELAAEEPRRPPRAQPSSEKVRTVLCTLLLSMQWHDELPACNFSLRS